MSAWDLFGAPQPAVQRQQQQQQQHPLLPLPPCADAKALARRHARPPSRDAWDLFQAPVAAPPPDRAAPSPPAATSTPHVALDTFTAPAFVADPARLAADRAAAAAAPLAPVALPRLHTWDDVFDLLERFLGGGDVGSLAAVAEVYTASAAGLDFPELPSMAAGAASTAAHRRAGTVAGHMSVARRFVQWRTTWSPQLRAADFDASVSLALACYVRARRNVPGAVPPPPADWPRVPRHPAPGPFVEPSSVGAEVARFCGLMTVLRHPLPAYGGSLPKAVLQAVGALEKHSCSPKVPVFAWHVITAFQRLWRSWLQSSPDRVSGFCVLALVVLGVMRPGFACGLVSGAARPPPAGFVLPALLLLWQGATKTRARVAPPALGGPAPESLDPVVSCVGHDLFRHTLFPFLAWLGPDRPPDSPLFPRVRARAAPGAAAPSDGGADAKLPWPGGGAWRVSAAHWSTGDIASFARELFSRAGFPDLLPDASGVHAGRVGGEMELEELGYREKTRDSIGQWAILQRRMHEVYGATAIQRMAQASACLGRLPLVRVHSGSVSLGLPADIDWEAAMPAVRLLGPVRADEPTGAWATPAFLQSLRAPPAGPPAPPRFELPFAEEPASAVEVDADEEADAIFTAACAAAPPAFGAALVRPPGAAALAPIAGCPLSVGGAAACAAAAALAAAPAWSVDVPAWQPGPPAAPPASGGRLPPGSGGDGGGRSARRGRPRRAGF